MKIGKAAGLDGITADMLKAEDIMTTKILRDISEQIWQTEETPKSLTTVITGEALHFYPSPAKF